ncbi:unnamed protein product [Prorocentrum cordatum]|uniref:Uncharacterized protein n=1 Tax=Prorocentrum cordatum TaxID=2364126 RepID=A0ABN9SYK4_9DINO|nr:unnamed protein product [Polarella glacialis]
MSSARPISNKRSIQASGVVSEGALTSGSRPRQSATTSTARQAGSSLASASSGAPLRAAAKKVGGRRQRLARPPAARHGPTLQPRNLVESRDSPAALQTYKAEVAEFEAWAAGGGRGLHAPGAADSATSD